MEFSSVTSKGQVVIPAELRHKYGIKPGVRIRFYDRDGEIRLVPITDEFIDQHIGFLETKGRLTRNLRQEKERERKL